MLRNVEAKQVVIIISNTKAVLILYFIQGLTAQIGSLKALIYPYKFENKLVTWRRNKNGVTESAST